MSAKLSIPLVDQTEQVTKSTYHIRGHEYVTRELTASEYEDQTRAASDMEEGTTDTILQQKLLTIASTTVDGKELPEDWFASTSYPVVNRVQNEMKRLHWVELETDEEIDTRKKKETAEERAAAKQALKDSAIPNS